MVARQKVLVVDDEPMVTKSCRRILAEAGYEVDTTESGREGLSRAFAQSFDVVMADLKMPDLDGMELVRLLRSRRPETEVIIITGYGTDPSKAEAARLGVSDYIEKPFAPERIRKAVSLALAYARTVPTEEVEVAPEEVTLPSLVTLKIDDREAVAEQGATVLEVAREIGIDIPTLCHHERLAPYGACRLCMVEIRQGKRARLVASCAYPVQDGLEVKTASERVVRVRKLLIELLLAKAPYMQEVQKLAGEYGIRETRFEKEFSPCLLCGLCVRYCAEVKGRHAVGFVGRGSAREVTWVPDSAFYRQCEDCMECLDICPTGVFPSNFGLAGVPQLREA